MDAEEANRRLKQRLWGATVVLAIAVIVLPLLWRGSGSESRFRRVEQLRAEPPYIIESDGSGQFQPIPEGEGPLGIAVGQGETEADTARPDADADPAADPAAPETVPDTVAGDTAAEAAGTATAAAAEEQPHLIDRLLARLNLERSVAGGESDVAEIDEAKLDAEAASVEPVDAALYDETALQNRALASGEVSVTDRLSGPPLRIEQIAPELRAASSIQTVPMALPTESPRPAVAEALNAWIVQAGSFRELDNAVDVRDRLRGAGYPTFISEWSEQGMHRVRIGPMVDAQRAERVRTEISRLLGRDAIVLSYP